MNCPCNSSKKYIDCCKKVHQDISQATTAEELMRSRYSAFVLSKIEYLQKSHHSTTKPSNRELRNIKKWTGSVSWIKLDVLNTIKGGLTDVEGVVEFKAFFMEKGKLDVIHEISSFKKENGYWVYLGIN